MPSFRTAALHLADKQKEASRTDELRKRYHVLLKSYEKEIARHDENLRWQQHNLDNYDGYRSRIYDLAQSPQYENDQPMSREELEVSIDYHKGLLDKNKRELAKHKSFGETGYVDMTERQEMAFRKKREDDDRDEANRRRNLSPDERKKEYEAEEERINVMYYGDPRGHHSVRSARTQAVPSASRVALAYGQVSARTAGMEQNIFDGSRKRDVLNTLNRLLDPFTKGLHRDQYWAPIQSIRKMFEQRDIPAMSVSNQYEKENGQDVRKVWLYEVPFINQNGQPDKVYIRIVASGSGPVDDPLAQYDVVAYAS
jgi:hypothetical protein